MTTTTELLGLAAWDIAKILGCNYFGDVNPIDHGGTFYNTADWISSGSADCVHFWQDEDQQRLVVECGMITRRNGDELKAIADSFGETVENLLASDHAEIQATHGHWGHDICQDFSGSYVKTFHFDASDKRVWQNVMGWIKGLGE